MQFEFPFRLVKLRTREPSKEWLRVGARQVPLALVPNRRARRYVLRLRPDGTARVSIPRGGSAVEARRFAERNIDWLEQQLLRHALRPPRSRAWTLGTEILFRGQPVQLEACTEVNETAEYTEHAQEGIENEGHGRESMRRGQILKGSRTDKQTTLIRFADQLVRINGDDLRPAVERHLWRLATRELPLRVRQLAALHQFTVGRITVRNQRSRWGSCSRHGTISLNWRLIQAGEFVRDYIILHELAHLKHLNHSRRFWAEVKRLCPDFERAEAWLKAHGDLLS